MPRGNNRPEGSGRVDRQAFMMMGADMDYFQNRAQDNAPAGGIPRPKMHGCLDCGTPTPSDNGDTCVDCTNDRDEASAESWARNQRADAVKGMFGYPR
jgi:hypothetical protein